MVETSKAMLTLVYQINHQNETIANFEGKLQGRTQLQYHVPQLETLKHILFKPNYTCSSVHSGYSNASTYGALNKQ